jgi:DNA-3-methyladenine glycosylase I
MADYADIFSRIESTLIAVGSENLPREKIIRNLDDFKKYEKQSFTDSEYFNKLVAIIFYSGFRASTVTNKMSTIRGYFSDYAEVANYSENKFAEIMSDSNMIRNRRKIQACIDNAQELTNIVSQFGSVNGYIESFEPTIAVDNLLLLKEDLEYRFKGLGRITTYHFLTDIGLPVLKPDRVICRIFERLGLIQNREQLLSAVIQGRKFAEAAGHPIRYIDIVLVAYGQMKSEEFGIKKGICLEKNPSCNMCGVIKYCNYFRGSLNTQ